MFYGDAPPFSDSFGDSFPEEPKPLPPPPALPRPPRSAFMCFHDDRKPFILEGRHYHTHDDVLSAVAQAWNTLSDPERAFWEERARQDKIAYARELDALGFSKSTTPKKKKRAKKDPSAPKKPMSAFLRYSKAQRAAVARKYPAMSNQDVSRLLGQQWRNATEEEKEPFVRAEFRERSEYHQAIKAWRRSQAAAGYYRAY